MLNVAQVRLSYAQPLKIYDRLISWLSAVCVSLPF